MNDERDNQAEDMKHTTYLFTWKVIGLGLLLLLSTGVCLAAFNQTDHSNQANTPTDQTSASNTTTTDTQNSNTVPTRTPVPTEEPTATETATTEPVASETAAPAIESETSLIAYLPIISNQQAQSGGNICGGLVQEAEQGELFGNMVVGTGGGASGEKYIHVPGDVAPIELLDNNHRADYCVTITESGQYTIKGWISAEKSSSDSFFVTLDNAPSNGIYWETFKTDVFQGDFVRQLGSSDPYTFNLTEGEHTFSVYYREANTKLDRFEFLSSSGEPVATAMPGGNPTATPKPDGGGGGNNEPTPAPSAGNLDGWPMAGANLERTSSVADGPDPSQHNNYGIKWYRPVEAYLGQQVQLIAGRDKIYAASAKGLYALNAETGNIAWRFDTELPLGHSPTLDGDRIFVGGFDKRIYALNADTGALIWTFEGAKSGYSTNPVVVNGQVLMGNRDGRFYSVNRENGQLNWQYPPANQDPLGPIMYSGAYKDGKVYFASNDNHAYALNINNGSLAWKSNKLPGDGYAAYWPVIFRDYVVFTSANPYVQSSEIGVRSIENTGVGDDLVIFFQRDDIYPEGNDNVRGEDYAEYLEQKPWRRTTIVLDTTNGNEYTMDVDNDGNPEYAPLLLTGTPSTNKYPPLIINNELYAANMMKARAGWGISRAAISKWEFGTANLEFYGMQYAIDEPVGDSAAGNIIYSNLCCDRLAVYYNLETEQNGGFWGYHKTLETYDRDEPQQDYQASLAPGYDDMWYGASMHHGLPRLNGAFGGINGIYHNHGIQNPLIPYKNMLFVHRGNAIIALGPDSVDLPERELVETIEGYENRIRTQYPDIALPLLTINQNPPTPASVLSNQDVKNLLDHEIEKMLDIGHLGPGYYNGTHAKYEEMKNYFENPGDTLLTLVEAYPHVSPSLQPRLRTYIDEHYNMYFATAMYAKTGYQGLEKRAWLPIPPEVQEDMDANEPSVSVGGGVGWDYPQHNLYAMWKYAKLFYSNDQAKLNSIYAQAASKLDKTPAEGEKLVARAWLDNGYIAGYHGFLELQELAGKSTSEADLRNEVTALLNSQLNKRATQFIKDQPYDVVTKDGDNFNRDFNVARNFIYLTPELGEYLRNNALAKMTEAIDEYEYVAPYWLSTRYEASVREMGNNNLYTVSSMFKAKAYILNEPPAQLRKYVDTPAFAVGDLIYIHNLVLALDK